MCGIAGILVSGVDKHWNALYRMTDALAHRGPDGEGHFAFADCALGHRRLAIVDLYTGQQPLFSPDGKVGLVFNGEIYGYQEIRSSLDYPFRTTSDTEVILALYERYGENLLDHLPGMFAFALWDDRKKLLFCARDRFGEKPLYYAQGLDGTFLFASEIKALLASCLLPPQRINNDALCHYLRRLYVPVGQSIYCGIHCLPPAHSLTLQDGKCKLHKYWHLPETKYFVSLDEAREEFCYLFKRAVQRQCVADVSVGAFLSGGLDSTTVVCEAAKKNPALQTMSFGFDSSIDERVFAQAAAEHYGTMHIEFSEKMLDLPALLPLMGQIYDEPFADSSNIPTYIISRCASERMKVVLTGDGGDELLGGYESYSEAYRHEALRCLPESMLRGVLLALRVGKKLGFGEKEFSRRYSSISRAIDYPTALEAHLAPAFSSIELERLGYKISRGNGQNASNSVKELLRFDLQNYMPGDILVKTDRASMANGLELRSPFLDVDLAEFCIALPTQLHVSKDSTKRVLRAAYGSQWPESIRCRSKQGFGSPVVAWLAQAEMRPVLMHYFAPRRKIFSLFPRDAVMPFVHVGSYQTWILLVLSIWLETYGGFLSL